MKGVSAVIATILMLIITIALAGMAYMYISGVFTGATQGIEVVDFWCSGGTVSLVIKNIGTDPITDITCTQTTPAADNTCDFDGALSIESGTSTTVTDDCTGTGGRNCVYRIVPPAGKTVVATVGCT